jgi:hypothetical protein
VFVDGSEGLPDAEAPGELIPPRDPLPGTANRHELASTGERAVVPAPVAANQDEGGRQQFLWNAHRYVNEYARFADSKAAFAGTLAGGLLAALYAAKAHVDVLSTSFDQWTLPAWLTVMAAALLAVSVGLAVWTVMPRLGSSQRTGFIYWGAIATHGTVDRFQEAFVRQSAHALNEHLAHHLFDLSVHVCIPKYRHAQWCIWCLWIGAVLAAAALIIKDVPAR